MKDVLALVGVFATLGVLWRLFTLIDPHWSSKDGHRCITVGQEASATGQSTGRWRDYRLAATEDGLVTGRRSQRAFGPDAVVYRVLSESIDARRKNKSTFCLERVGEETSLLVVRMPSSSRTAAVFRELLDDSRET